MAGREAEPESRRSLLTGLSDDLTVRNDTGSAMIWRSGTALAQR
jgi:hypothetical protein